MFSAMILPEVCVIYILSILPLFMGMWSQWVYAVLGPSFELRLLILLSKLNVVVHANGRAALCDFGLSYINTSAERVESSKRVVKAFTGITKSQTVRYTTAGYTGTLRYLSPEQLPSDLDIVKPTFAADVYAFACTLAEVWHPVNQNFNATHESRLL